MRSSKTAALIALVLFLVACGEPPDPVTPQVEGVSGSWSCEVEDDTETWTFQVILSGPANENSTRVWVDEADAPAVDSHLMTVQSSGGERITFGIEVPGTPEGEEPQDGSIPQSCSDADQLLIRFCASPDGMPYEIPCWVCGDGESVDLPENADDWLDCGD